MIDGLQSLRRKGFKLATVLRKNLDHLITFKPPKTLAAKRKSWHAENPARNCQLGISAQSLLHILSCQGGINILDSQRQAQRLNLGKLGQIASLDKYRVEHRIDSTVSCRERNDKSGRFDGPEWMTIWNS